MERSKKKTRFKFVGKQDLELGVEGDPDIVDLQSILLSLGHLRGAYEPGRVCACTERAIRRYQRYYHLKSDGIVGPITRTLLEKPRCGVPDIPVVRPDGGSAGPYVLRGCKYSKQELTYSFLNGTGDLAGNVEREIVASAFDAWAGVANIAFSERPPAEATDFRIAWRSTSHGDGEPFDGPGNVLAHAFFPPPCGGPRAGDLHFDEGETWVDDPSAAGILLRQVAIHEIGHLLGLSHSNEEAAIMYAYYGADRVNLAQDDIDGVQALYGAPSRNERLLLETEAGGTLPNAGDERFFEIEMPTTLSVTIDGPADADFDLYLRKEAPPTTDVWDQRAYSATSQEQVIFSAEPGVKYFVMVRSYGGSGDFDLKVTPGS